VAEVRDLIGQIDDLRFEARVGRRIEFLRGGTIVKMRMLDDALAHLEAQVETAKIRIANLDPIDSAQALRVMIEAAVGAHQIVEDFFAGVSERRMPKVVSERDRFGELLV